MHNEHILSLMTSAAKSAGRIVTSAFRTDIDVKEKTSHADVVTSTDVASQRNIHDLLLEGMQKLGYAENEIGFIQEESSSNSVRQHNFIVDPIDGTTNFASGIPFSCISIAYAASTTLRLGVVYDPFSDTLYSGEVGNGSCVESLRFGKKSLALQHKPIDDWIVSAQLNGQDENEVAGQFATYQKIYPQVRGLRNMGSLTLELCLMADNVVDALYNHGSFFWDLAAVSVILREAGGELYDIDARGQVLEFDWEDTQKKYRLFACRPEAQETVHRFLPTRVS